MRSRGNGYDQSGEYANEVPALSTVKQQSNKQRKGIMELKYTEEEIGQIVLAHAQQFIPELNKCKIFRVGAYGEACAEISFDPETAKQAAEKQAKDMAEFIDAMKEVSKNSEDKVIANLVNSLIDLHESVERMKGTASKLASDEGQEASCQSA